MTLTLHNEADESFQSFAKLIATFQAKQYLLAAQSVWWISAIIGLQPALVFFIDNQQFPSELRLERDQTPTSVSRVESRLVGADKTASDAGEPDD